MFFRLFVLKLAKLPIRFTFIFLSVYLRNLSPDVRFAEVI